MLDAERLAQVGRFLAVGVASAIVDVGGLWVLHGLLGVWLPLAAATSFLASFAVNFGLNQRWTFQAQTTRTRGQLVRFTILVVANTLVTAVAVTAITGLGLQYLLAKFIAMAVLFVVNFVVLRVWVFQVAEQEQA